MDNYPNRTDFRNFTDASGTIVVVIANCMGMAIKVFATASMASTITAASVEDLCSHITVRSSIEICRRPSTAGF